MPSNCEYLRNPAGILKTISIGLITLTFIAASISHFTSEYARNRDKVRPLIGDKSVNLWREIYLITSATVCLILSVTNLAIHLISREIYWNRKTAVYDFLYHSAAFLLLSTSGVLHIVSAVKLFDINCRSDNGCQDFELKFAAGGVSLVTALICGVIAVVVLTNRKDVERDGLISDSDEK